LGGQGQCRQHGRASDFELRRVRCPDDA
jgi:hypothetical protein